MNNKKVIMTGIVALVVGAGGGFYGGMQYTNSKNASVQGANGYTRGMNGQANRQAGLGGPRNGGLPGGGGRGGMMGQIISKDATSFNVKMPDGSSKIVFYSDTTTVGKSTPGSASDLTVGQQVRVNGQDNADGSVAAQNVQITQGQ